MGDVEFWEGDIDKTIKLVKPGWRVYGIVGTKMKDPGMFRYDYVNAAGVYATIQEVANCLWFYHGLRQRTVTSFPIHDIHRKRWSDYPDKWKEKVSQYEQKYGMSAQIIAQGN